MIKTIKLKFGRASGLPSEEVFTTPITVFVGPNYSGKSKVLSEIYYYCTSGQQNVTDVILEKIEFDTFSVEAAEEKIKKSTLQPHIGEALLPDHIIVGKKGTRHQVPRQNFLHALQNPNSQANLFCHWYLAFNTLLLNGGNRINLIGQQSAGDPAIILIDEPEAFLSLSLAFKLGKEIAISSLNSQKRLFVSTHSPNFVMGCIQSGAPVNIVRLTYRSEVATARVLPNADILR